MNFDLHFHSAASDGTADLEAILRAAYAHPEITRLALADHDTIAASVALALALPDRAIVATELTVAAGHGAPHLLALGVAADHPGLTTYLRTRAEERAARFAAWAGVLRSLGYRFDPDPALADRGLGKPHVVAELRRHPENAGILPPPVDPSASDPIYGTLLKVGGPADVSRLVPSNLISMVDAIALVRAAGGLAILAHPLASLYTIGQNRVVATWQSGAAKARATLAQWRAAGLDGIEVWTPSQREDPTLIVELLDVATGLDLLPTPGSDDHSADLDWLGNTGISSGEAAVYNPRFDAALRARRG